MTVTTNVISSGDLYRRAEEAARRASQNVMTELFGAMQQSFTAKAWAWPRETLRGGGVVVGSPRNLIDTANLRQSGNFQMVAPYLAKMQWSASYAAPVHEGAWIRPWGNQNAERVYLPARPWTRAVLGLERVNGIEPFPVGERLRDVWLAYFRLR